MEFQALITFFNSLVYAKRKYPQSVTYRTKYLQSLSEDKQFDEVEKFKLFLMLNQNLHKKILDCAEFTTGKSGVLLMTNFLDGKNDNIFWDAIAEVEQKLFPFGKPKEAPKQKQSAVSEALNKFKGNPIIVDVIKQISQELGSLDGLGINDVNDLINRPEFQKIVAQIRTNLMSGKHSIQDLTQSVVNVIDTVKDESSVDTKTQTILDDISSTMVDLKNNNQVDFNKLLNLIGSLNFGKDV